MRNECPETSTRRRPVPLRNVSSNSRCTHGHQRKDHERTKRIGNEKKRLDYDSRLRYELSTDQQQNFQDLLWVFRYVSQAQRAYREAMQSSCMPDAGQSRRK